MPVTSLDDDIAYFKKLHREFTRPPARKGSGRVILAGRYWPPTEEKIQPPRVNGILPPVIRRRLPNGEFKEREARGAVTGAREIVTRALLAAKGAVSGSNLDAQPLMVKWFGQRETQGGCDWWLGVATILGAVEACLVSDIHLYYHADPALVGKDHDCYPEWGPIQPDDIEGCAEVQNGGRDNCITLCRQFFQKVDGRGQAKMNLRGFNSTGGCLVHELSHNLCGTLDHEWEPDSWVYGIDDCKALAALEPTRAWYNADNIEYFCEEVGFPPVTQDALDTGAQLGVQALRARFNQK